MEKMKLSNSMDSKLVLFYYLVPLLLLMTVLSLLGVQLINNIYLFFSYFWVITFLNPYASEKIGIAKYRFSTLRFLFIFNDFIQKKSSKYLKNKYDFLSRGVPPILLVLFLWAIFYSGQFIFAIVGYGYFEFVHFIFLKKLNWNPFEDRIFYMDKV